ncbi:MAG: mannose-6-phosphate isomerase, class I [Deltaproteobacteria bacterium]|nr:mannose-6-phosphate isomerase, class I [Deltaproteobacteria bacterium]
MWRLDNSIAAYPWGSRVAIAQLQGRPFPTAEPEAELWMGAHPRGPSRVSNGGETLAAAIERAPQDMLGPDVVARFGPRLPLLLKVLAAAEPLSLQAHPNPEQARDGFRREEAAGIEVDAPHRNYRDPYAKPELLCALGPFTALCGFAPIERIRARIEALGVPHVRAGLHPLWSRPPAQGLAAAMEFVLTMERPEPLAQAVGQACTRMDAGDDAHARHRACIARLAQRYPADRGVVVALLLNLVELSEGEALYLGAGQLHCYLDGTGVEIMASSDNVLRGGLTPKHMDPPELLRVLEFDPQTVEIRRPRPLDGGEQVYDVPTDAFALSRIDLGAGERWRAPVAGPEILLCTAGAVKVTGADAATVCIGSGHSAFVSASEHGREVEAGEPSTVFRATVG